MKSDKSTEHKKITLNLNVLSPFDYKKDKKDRIDENYFQIYKEALDEAKNNPKIKNVGVTGGYGTGKSSIIHSYFDDENQEKTFFISLAHFSSLAGNQLPNAEEINSQIDNILEMKIVNQLVNQIEPSKIPKANFTAKQNAIETDRELLKLKESTLGLKNRKLIQGRVKMIDKLLMKDDNIN